MTDAQRKDVDIMIGNFEPFHPVNLRVEEKSKKEVLLTFQLDDGPNDLKSWYFLGNWDGEQYQWQFQHEGMPEN